MKLKGLLKSFFILGLTLLPISFSSAGFTRQFDLLSTVKTVGGNSDIYNTNSYFRVNSNNGTLYTSYLGTSKPVFYTYYDSGGFKRFWLFYWDNNGLPYLFAYSSYRGHELNLQGNFTQYQLCNYISSVPVDSAGNSGPSGCSTFDVGTGFNEFLGNFFSSIVPSDKYYYRTDGGNTSTYTASQFNICFSNSSLEKSLCFTANGRAGSNVEGYFNTTLINSVGYLPTLDFASLNISENEPGINPNNGSNNYYYSTGSCPSVGQLKAGSNLTPNVCFAGFNSSDIYGDSSTFVAGQGLNIFDVYNMYSGGMLLQGWYDTYYNYYKDINNNVSMFEGKSKALLGTFFARQTFSDGLIGSYNILNYCYYVVNNIPDNTSTCVGSNVSTQYSGVVISDYDREDILDSIIGWQDSVRIQSGFDTGDLTDVYNRSYSLFSSRTVDPGFNGIIPSYIVIGFLGIVLLYFLRR